MDMNGNAREGVELTDLAVLDPARTREPSAEEWIRARATVDRIVASGGTAPHRVRPRYRWRRFALAGAGVAVAVAGTVAVPTLLPNAGERALAAWTAEPDELSGGQVPPLAAKCAEQWPSWDAGTGPTDVLVAERRGVGSLLVVRRGSKTALCMSLDSRRVSAFGFGGTEWPGRPPGGGRATLAVTLKNASEKLEYSGAVGQVGPSVVGIDLVMRDGKVIHASVRSGWWAAWWPGADAGQTISQVVVHTATGSTTFDKNDLPVDNLPR